MHKKLKSLILPVVFLILIIPLWLWNLSYHAFDDDEFQHTHAAWLISQGEKPYVDFFEHHFVLFHGLLAPFAMFTEGITTVFVFRTLSLIFAGLTFFFIYILGRCFGTSPPAVFSGIFLLAIVPMFMLKMGEVRPAGPALMLFLISLYLLFRASHQTGKNSKIQFFAKYAFPGFIAGIMVLLTQKFIFLAGGLVLVSFLIGRKYKAVPFFISGGFAALFLYLAWMFSIGSLKACFENVVIMNLNWKRSFSPEGYLTEMFTTAGPLVIMGLLGILQELMRPRLRREAFILLILLGASVLEIFMIPVPFRQAFLPLLTIMSIGSMVFFEELFHAFNKCSRGPATKKLAVASFAVIGLALPSMISLEKEFHLTNQSDISKIKKIEELIPEGPFFDGRGIMVSRQHTGYHACMHEGIQLMLDPDKYSSETIHALIENELPPVIFDYRVNKMPEPIKVFISENYITTSIPELMLPGFSIDRSKLSGRGTEIKVLSPGLYKASWTGGKVFIDGKEIVQSETVFLAKGLHSLKGKGFIRNFKMIREYRK